MEEGYAAASMSAIAARVGGSKGTLYNYFRSKAELFAAVIRDDCSREQEALFDTDQIDDDLEKTLLTLGKRLIRLMLSDDVIVIHRILAAESCRFPEIGEAHFEAGPKRGKQFILALFAKGQQEGKLRPMDNPERAAEQLVELVLAGVYRRRLWNLGPFPTEAEMDANVESAVAVFMAAYGTP